MEQFCERLKELREEAGYSMQQLAVKIGVSNAAVCKWENGAAEPKVSYLIKLAERFDCTIDYLVGKTDDFNTLPRSPEETPLKLNAKEKQVIASYRNLSPKLQDLLQDTLTAWQKNDKA